jgi:glyoxylase-like metal-dependent hydrolase (beta-lactamase superfamily II)
MLTKLFPMVQFQKDTWEIDEFDCASMFLLIGSEKAMLIDLGMGIGDLRGAVEMLTDKPIIPVITHSHLDHTGHARAFSDVWIHPKDMGKSMPGSLERRIYDTRCIARRQKGSVGAPYNMFRLYGFDIDVDLREPQNPEPAVHPLYDGQEFDLGDRLVTVLECPGHSPGQTAFLDHNTRCLFVGDALNYNLGVASVPVETTLRYLERLQELSDQYDYIFNGHHDFRALGAPLEADCLENAIGLCRDILDGHWSAAQVPSFWGQDMPLGAAPAPNLAPPMFPGQKVVPAERVTVRRGRNFLTFDPNKIFE